MAAVLDAPAPVIAQGRLRGFASCRMTFDDVPAEVRGALPEWLRGNLLLNGPALWELDEGRYAHWFDGLAMLHRLRIAGGRAVYRSRFLQSEDYRRSIAARRPAFGGFDTRDPSTLMARLRHFTSPPMTDNGAVVMSRIGERWIAQTETPLVTEFDPDTLETSGRVAFEDDLHIQLMSAHGMTDARGTYWNVGVQLGPKCTYSVFRVRPGSARRETVGTFTAPKSGYLHAFAMSRRHAIVWEPALRAQPLGFLFTRRAYIRNFRWDAASGSRLHAIDLDTGRVASWSMPPMMCFHAVQAYERGDDIVLDLCVFDDAQIMDDLALARLRSGAATSLPEVRRFVMKRGASTAAVEPLGARIELPQVHPGKIGATQAKIAWGAGVRHDAPGAFFNRTVRLDLSSGAETEWVRDRAVQLEPLYVPRPGAEREDDGVLLVPTLADEDAGSVIGVVDARSMACLATIHAPQVIPFGFHAAFALAR
jgi:beta,beta-carotene 9',10'-dioxygenase